MDFENAAEALLVLKEPLTRSKGGTVTAVYDNGDAETCVPIAAWAREPTSKANACQRGRDEAEDVADAVSKLTGVWDVGVPPVRVTRSRAARRPPRAAAR